MAEFCIDCWNQMNGKKHRKKYILSKEMELCEGCGKYKHVIVKVRQPLLPGLISRLKF